MQATPTERTARTFEIEINGKPVICAEARITPLRLEGVHGEISAFYERLWKAFITYTEKELAPEFAARFAAASTLRERCGLKIPVLTLRAATDAAEQDTLTVITQYSLAEGARTVKKGEIKTLWDVKRGVILKDANGKRGT